MRFETLRCSGRRFHTITAITTLASTSNQKTAVVHTGLVTKATTSENGFGFIGTASVTKGPSLIFGRGRRRRRAETLLGYASSLGSCRADCPIPSTRRRRGGDARPAARG